MANIFLRLNEKKDGAECDHWQLNEFESLSGFALDYRVT